MVQDEFAGNLLNKQARKAKTTLKKKNSGNTITIQFKSLLKRCSTCNMSIKTDNQTRETQYKMQANLTLKWIVGFQQRYKDTGKTIVFSTDDALTIGYLYAKREKEL